MHDESTSLARSPSRPGPDALADARRAALRRWLLAGVVLVLVASGASSQVVASASGAGPRAGGVILPQRHALRLGDQAGQVGMAGVDCRVLVQGRSASTTLVIHVFNPHPSAQE